MHPRLLIADTTKAHLTELFLEDDAVNVSSILAEKDLRDQVYEMTSPQGVVVGVGSLTPHGGEFKALADVTVQVIVCGEYTLDRDMMAHEMGDKVYNGLLDFSIVASGSVSQSKFVLSCDSFYRDKVIIAGDDDDDAGVAVSVSVLQMDYQLYFD